VIKSSTEGYAGHVTCTGKRGGAYRVLLGKPERKRPLGRPMHRWENNINMKLQEVGYMGGMDWINLAQTGTGWESD